MVVGNITKDLRDAGILGENENLSSDFLSKLAEATRALNKEAGAVNPFYPNSKSKVVQYFDTNTSLQYEVYLNCDIQTNMPYIGTVYLAK